VLLVLGTRLKCVLCCLCGGWLRLRKLTERLDNKTMTHDHDWMSKLASLWLQQACGHMKLEVKWLSAKYYSGESVMARPLSPPPPLWSSLAMRRPPGRRRSESPEFPPVPSCSRSPHAAAPVSEARQSRCSVGAVMMRQAAWRLAPARNLESPANLQRPGRRSTRRQDFPKDTCGSRTHAEGNETDHWTPAPGCTFSYCIIQLLYHSVVP